MTDFTRLTLIDLRPQSQREAAPLLSRGAVLKLSLDDIEAAGVSLAPEQTYLVVCERGPRAALAARYLRADGLNAQAWKGTLDELREALEAQP